MTQRGESVSFDRAAGFYDATRRFSPKASCGPDRPTARRAARHRRTDAGDRRRHRPGGAPAGRRRPAPRRRRHLARRCWPPCATRHPSALPLVQADATRLPFRDGTFGGAVVAHVLHLVSDWRAVVAELRRVVRPGGVLLVTRGRAPGPGCRHEITQRARRLAGWTMPPVDSTTSPRLDEHIRSVGGRSRQCPAPDRRTRHRRGPLGHRDQPDVVDVGHRR